MSLHPAPAPTAAERFDAELARTVDRVRGLALTRLEAGFAPEPTRADAVRAVAQLMADAAAGLEGEPRRELPRTAVHAVGDQLAVCGHDLRLAADAERDAGTLTEAADTLLDLRRRL